MSQNDLTIANQGFASFRSDLNSALQALGSTNSGTSAPSTTFANQLFYDTTNNILKIRNEDNDAFISLFTLDQTNDNIEALTISGTLTYTGDLVSSTAGTSNFRAGVNAGNSIASGGNYNVTVGDEAGTAISTGDENTFIGYATGDATSTGIRNVAVGSNALGSNVAGDQSVAVGFGALFSQNPSGNADMNNVAIGHDAGFDISTGSNNTLVGALSGDAITTASNNTATGMSALGANTTGAENTAFGAESLLANTTASNNTAIGKFALGNNTTGANNTAVASNSLDANTTGASNTALGLNSLGANTTASFNTAVGASALKTNTTGGANTAFGVEAGFAIVTGENNTVIGRSAGIATTASNNTFIGRSSGSQITSGASNTIIGRYQGNSGGLDIRTSSNNIVLSDGDGVPRLRLDSSGDLYVQRVYDNTTGNGANVFVGSDGQFERSTSSQRYKNTVNDATYGLAELLTLRPVTYKNNNDGDTVFGGLIAEEVHDAGLTEFVQYDDDGQPDALAYGNMVSLCIKAIQELKTELDSAKARIATLEGA